MSNVLPFDALNDPTRRKLLERLREGPASVSELVDSVPVSQPAVSQHLKVLKDARLVQMHKQAQKRIYSLDPQGFSDLRAYIDRFWDAALAAYQKAAEEYSTEKPDHE
jgi:DNA-binding transcriptional ArsR family regulator